MIFCLDLGLGDNLSRVCLGTGSVIFCLASAWGGASSGVCLGTGAGGIFYLDLEWGGRSESFGAFLPGFCLGRYFVRSLSWDGVGGIFCLGLDSGVGRSEFLAGGRRRAGG